MCFNKKVLAGLAVVAVGVLVLAPGLLSRALPLLVLAACPLSMVFMMRGMGRMGSMASDDAQKANDAARDDRAAEVGSGAPTPTEHPRFEDDAAHRRELEEEINRLRAEINLRDAGRS